MTCTSHLEQLDLIVITIKKSKFMTNGLLVSRKKKNELHKLSLTVPSVDNIQRHKIYRNLYNKLIRASKKLTIGEELRKNSKNPKKNLGYSQRSHLRL
jgi:hypothetical protein